MRSRIATEILKAAVDIETGYSNLAMARTNVALSAEAYRIARLQFEAGVINNLDCLDAEAKLTQSRFGEVLAEYRYTLSRYALQQVSGYNFAAMADSTANQ
jgi:outer membrane protein TolC